MIILHISVLVNKNLKGVVFISREYKHLLTDYGIKVRTKLMELGRPQGWLIAEVAQKTEMFVDDSRLNKILTGRANSDRIVIAINQVLGFIDE